MSSTLYILEICFIYLFLLLLYIVHCVRVCFKVRLPFTALLCTCSAVLLYVRHETWYWGFILIILINFNKWPNLMRSHNRIIACSNVLMFLNCCKRYVWYWFMRTETYSTVCHDIKVLCWTAYFLLFTIQKTVEFVYLRREVTYTVIS